LVANCAEDEQPANRESATNTAAHRDFVARERVLSIGKFLFNGKQVRTLFETAHAHRATSCEVSRTRRHVHCPSGRRACPGD
jgi:hypothetical protein